MNDSRLDELRMAVLSLAETHQLTAEEMVGMGLMLFASFLPVLIADAAQRSDAAHSMLDEALRGLDEISVGEVIN